MKQEIERYDLVPYPRTYLAGTADEWAGQKVLRIVMLSTHARHAKINPPVFDKGLEKQGYSTGLPTWISVNVVTGAL